MVKKEIFGSLHFGVLPFLFIPFLQHAGTDDSKTY